MSDKEQLNFNREFTIVLPCYNESHRLALSLPDLFQWRHQFQKQNNCLVRIMLANDGCTDGTVELAKELAHGEINFDIIGYAKNQGRGAVLKAAFPQSSPQSLFVLYMDADLATDLKHVHEVYDLFLKQPQKLVICGNRYFKESGLKRPLLRKIWSWGWRSFLSLLFLKKLPDTQCGFKALSYDLIHPVISQLRIKGFVADVEIILRAWSIDAEVRSVNVSWVEKKGSTIRWGTILKMLFELKDLKLNLESWLADTRSAQQSYSNKHIGAA